MTEPLRTAIVGCGAIAHWHLDAIDRAGVPITVTAAIDPDAEHARSASPTAPARAAYRVARRRARRPAASTPRSSRCRTISTSRSRSRRSAPACTCCSRSRSRRRSTRATASSPRRGAAGTVFMVAENAQYWPEVLTVRDLIADGAIGEVVTARAATFFPALGDFYGGDRPWRFDRAAAGGGVVIDTGSHWLRPLRMWLGEVDEVVAALGHPHPGMEGESLCRALLRFESGTVATFDAMLTTGGDRDRSRCSPSPARRGELTVEGSGLGEAVGRHRLEGHEGRRAGRLPALVRSRARRLRPRGAARHAARRDRRVRARRAPARARDVPLGRDASRWEKVWA